MGAPGKAQDFEQPPTLPSALLSPPGRRAWASTLDVRQQNGPPDGALALCWDLRPCCWFWVVFRITVVFRIMASILG